MATEEGAAPAADPRALAELAERTAAEAGRVAAEGQEGIGVLDTKSTPTDVVTEMDRRVEELVRKRLLEVRPGDAVLGEEGGEEAGSAGGVRWIVDPIDGTVNYLYGREEWAVSIAAEVDGEVVAGAVVAPRLGDTYTAVLGAGAFCNGAPLRAGPAPAPELALVATGFGYDPRRRAHQAEVLRSVLPRVRDIRRGGSAAIDICSLARGRADAYYERGLNPWDWAAACLVAREAGLRVEGLHGAPPSSDLTIAAGPGLFESLHAMLEPLGADTDGPA
ncbi:inositol monophosphatase family protein [Nocardiopsis sp. RSe5-2]|uniref:Inositol-1-monophosphatase n=1 Tax=Nocardiopsis endophytica TaxID=3018445 RepID=A0ABT4U941_9ACTN|nr:inositol monophosphatase family protein [Nocardiopsis endophytica]MDA2813464.1 inositol monophosphatase family protein [Nocardiopsis endophytica]